MYKSTLIFIPCLLLIEKTTKVYLKNHTIIILQKLRGDRVLLIFGTVYIRKVNSYTPIGNIYII